MSYLIKKEKRINFINISFMNYKIELHTLEKIGKLYSLGKTLIYQFLS